MRDAEVFATYDGAGTLRIGTAETLDGDDSIAQLVLHEMCHALVAGPDGWSAADWGLGYADPRHAISEHATLRLQAALADRHGLRKFLAATTEHRSYYDALPTHCLSDVGEIGNVTGDFNRADLLQNESTALQLARLAWERAHRAPWAEALEAALSRTAELARVVQPLAPKESLWSVCRLTEARDRLTME